MQVEPGTVRVETGCGAVTGDSVDCDELDEPSSAVMCCREVIEEILGASNSEDPEIV